MRSLEGKGAFGAGVVSVDFDGTSEVTFDQFGVPDAAGEVVIGSGKSRAMMTVDQVGGDVQVRYGRGDDSILFENGEVTLF